MGEEKSPDFELDFKKKTLRRITQLPFDTLRDWLTKLMKNCL